MENWTDFKHTASDGLILAGRVYGWNGYNDTGKEPVVCLPDYFKNANEFHELAMALSTHPKHRRIVFVFDYRGRGNSAFDKNEANYNLLQECNDLIAGLIARNVGHADFIASPHGGLMLFNLSGLKPGMISSVTINDVGPEFDAQSMLRTKNNIANVSSFPNWDAAGIYWKAALKSQFTSFKDADWLRFVKQIYKEVDDKIVYDFDPKLIGNLQALDLDNRFVDMWPQFRGLKKIPVLLLHGENSEVLSPEKINKMREHIEQMEVVKVKGQGHSPDYSSASVIKFLSTYHCKAA